MPGIHGIWIPRATSLDGYRVKSRSYFNAYTTPLLAKLYFCHILLINHKQSPDSQTDRVLNF